MSDKFARPPLDMAHSLCPLAERRGGRNLRDPPVKEGKYALKQTRLSYHRVVANRVRRQLFILAYDLGNFLRRLTPPKAVGEWCLQSVQLKLIKTGARLVRHARRLAFQMPEVAVPRGVWAAVVILNGRS
jgi:hypothetical protein